MAGRKYETSLIIRGDGKGGVQAVKATREELEQLNTAGTKGKKVTKDYGKAQKDAAKDVDGFGSKVGMAATAVVAAGVAMVGAVSAVAVANTQLIQSTVNTADAIGVSTENLMAMSAVSRQYGVDMDALSQVMGDVSIKVTEFAAIGTGEAADFFEKMNLDVREFASLRPDELLLRIGKELEGLNQNERILFLDQLGSDDAVKLSRVIGQLGEMKAEALALGIALSDVDAKQVALAGQALDRVGQVSEGVKNHLSLALAPIITDLSDRFYQSAVDAGGMGSAIDTAVEIGVKAFGFLMDTLHGLDVVITGLQVGFASLPMGFFSTLRLLDRGVTSMGNSLLSLLTPIKKLLEVAGYLGNDMAADAAKALDGLKFQTSQGLDSAFGLYERAFDDLVDELAAKASEVMPSEQINAWYAQVRKGSENTARTIVESSKKQVGASGQYVSTLKASDAAVQASAKGTKTALKDTAQEASVWAQMTENAIDRVDDAFFNLFRSAFDGFADFKDAMVNTAKDLMAQLVYTFAKQKLMVSMGMTAAGVSASGGVSAGELSSQGLGDIWSSLGKMTTGNSVGSGFASVGNYLGSNWGIGGAQSVAPTSAFQASNFTPGTTDGGMFANAGAVPNWQYGVAGIGGGLLGATAGGQGSLGGSLGATAGMALGGPIGSAIGAVLGSAIGSLFGGKWEPNKNELRLDYEGGDASGDVFSQQRKKKLWKYKYKDSVAELPTEFTDSINSYFDQMETGIAGLAEQFGIDGAQAAIEAYSSGVTSVDIMGKTDAEIQQSLSDWGDSITRALVEQVFGGSELADLQRSGENLSGTVFRLAAELQMVTQATAALNLQFGVTGLESVKAADGLVQLFGGLEQFASATANYYDKFYTDQEKFFDLTEQLDQAFGALNLTLPDTRDGFRQLVEAQDLATASGRETYAALMLLTDGTDQYITSLSRMAASLASPQLVSDAGFVPVHESYFENYAQAILNNHDTELRLLTDRHDVQIDSLREQVRIADSLRDTVSSLKLSDISPLSPAQQFGFAKAEYLRIKTKADAGDMDAWGEIGGAAQGYLQQFASYTGSTAGYTAEFASVTNYLEQLGQTLGDSDDLQDKIEDLNRRQLSEQERLRSVAASQLDKLAGIYAKVSQIPVGMTALQALFSGLPASLAAQLGAATGSTVTKEALGNAVMGSSYAGVDINSYSDPNKNQINGFYRAFLERNADTDGLSFWLDEYLNGSSMAAISNAIATSSEAKTLAQLPKFNGSHANGLDYVPFDGYVAQLHQGERVLTRAEASDSRGGSNNAELIAEVRKLNQKLDEQTRQLAAIGAAQLDGQQRQTEAIEMSGIRETKVLN